MSKILLQIFIVVALPMFSFAESNWKFVGEEYLSTYGDMPQQVIFDVWDNVIYKEMKIQFVRDGVELEDVYVYTYSNFRWDLPTLVGDYEMELTKIAPIGISSPIKSIRIMVKPFTSFKRPIMQVFVR